ncbi:MAG: hypothetical protein JNJ85_13735 [Candidatus Kapabacteria bacterium]|nr:hypothetical protein [Candidatus Kapabacteria bacterium]
MIRNSKCIERLLRERVNSSTQNTQTNVRIVNELHRFACQMGMFSANTSTECPMHITIAKVINSVHRIP